MFIVSVKLRGTETWSVKWQGGECICHGSWSRSSMWCDPKTQWHVCHPMRQCQVPRYPFCSQKHLAVLFFPEPIILTSISSCFEIFDHRNTCDRWYCPSCTAEFREFLTSLPRSSAPSPHLPIALFWWPARPRQKTKTQGDLTLLLPTHTSAQADVPKFLDRPIALAAVSAPPAPVSANHNSKFLPCHFLA